MAQENVLRDLITLVELERYALRQLALRSTDELTSYLREAVLPVGESRYHQLHKRCVVRARLAGLFPFDEIDRLTQARDAFIVRCWDVATSGQLGHVPSPELDIMLQVMEMLTKWFDAG